ncbi:MAG: hypothetical protein IJS15_06595 [Victivallales bacterium]|nr:hypothetical protein [Victivallales bacterium]
MNKNSIIAILAVLVGLMAITLMVVSSRNGGNGGAGRGPFPPPPQHTPAETNPPPKVAPVPAAGTKSPSAPMPVGEPVAVTNTPSPQPLVTPPPQAKPLPVSVERELPPVKEGDVERLPRKDEPQGLTSIFEVTGKGTLAAAGGAGDVSFYYLMKTVATSKIEDKEEFNSGKIKVTEIRAFSEATEVMKVSDVNLRVDLSTVPVDAIANTGYLIGGVASLFDPELGLSIADTVADFRNTIDSFNGTDAKPAFDMLKKFGIDVQRIISEPVEGYLKGLMDQVHSHVNAVKGKSYRFIYWTDKAGEPLRVRYENVDHSPISLEEQNVLNYVNLFIDCHVLPDKNCRPGASWTINPASIGNMFGAVADGACSGEVRVRRGNDLPDGNWSLSVDPATITFFSEDRRPVGNVKLCGGKGIGDGRRAILRELQIDGKGKLRKKESDTYLWFYEFITKTEGDCQFRSTISPRVED